MPGRVPGGSLLPLSLLVLGEAAFGHLVAVALVEVPRRGGDAITSAVPREESQHLALLGHRCTVCLGHGTALSTGGGQDSSCGKGLQEVSGPTSSSCQLWGQTRLLGALVSWVLETSKAGGSTAFLGILYHF